MQAQNAPDSSTPPTMFRVIVVGAGITGLTAALALGLAGIEYIVVEGDSTPAPTTGEGITLYPNSSRILHQLGVYQNIKRQCQPMQKYIERLPDGTDLIDSKFFEYLSNEFNTHPLLLDRHDLLLVLYEQIANKKNIRYDTTLESITTFENYVTATLSDGSVENASLIIGADGLHSTVREKLWRHANETVQDTVTTIEKTDIRSTWKSLRGTSPILPGIEPQSVVIIHNTHHSILLRTDATKMFFSVFFKNSEPSDSRQHKRYSAADANTLAETVAAHLVSKDVTFGEIWTAKHHGTLIDVYEGVLNTWHSNRIVLLGSAAHSVTPNAGLGPNLAIEAAASLVNHLHDLTCQSDTLPTTAMINNVLKLYTEARKPVTTHVHAISNQVTNLHAWDTWIYWFLARHVIPRQSDKVPADALIDLINDAPWLEFVPLEREWRFGKARDWERREELWKMTRKWEAERVDEVVKDGPGGNGRDISSTLGLLKESCKVVIRIALGVCGAFAVADLCTRFMPGLWLPV